MTKRICDHPLPWYLIVSLILLFSSNLAYPRTDKYRLVLNDDPAKTIVIAWNQVSGKAPLVYYGPEDYGLDYKKYPHKHMPDKIIPFKGMKNCFAHLQFLKPATDYFFVIKDEDSISKRFWFRTCAYRNDARLSIVAGGDSRNNRDIRQKANLLAGKLKPNAIMFGGDMVRSGSEEQWQDWFDDWQNTISDSGRMIPLIVARGNHERENAIIYNLFDTSSEDIYYAISFGKDLLRIYTLNTEISIKGDQTDWLRSDLESHRNFTWRMAQYHKPIRPHVLRKYEGETTYKYWAPLFFKYEVKLVVECDAHTVKTTWPVRPEKTRWKLEGFVRDDENGTVFTGEGCWGAPTRPANDPKEWTRAYGEFNQFKWIFIDQDKIEMRTVKVDNAKKVGSNPDDDPFSIPENLDVWKPDTGEIVTIYP